MKIKLSRLLISSINTHICVHLDTYFEHLIHSRHTLGRSAGKKAVLKGWTGKTSLRSCPGLEGSESEPTGYPGEHSRQREPQE